MMKCKAARKFFSAAFDGELSLTEERELRGHLSSCPACSREFVLFSRSVRLVNSLPTLAPGALFEQKLGRALDAKQSVSTGLRIPLFTTRPAVAFSAAMVFVVLLVLVPSNGSDFESQLLTSQLEMAELKGRSFVEAAGSDLGTLRAPSDKKQFGHNRGHTSRTSEIELASYGSDSGNPGVFRANGTNENTALFDVEFVLDPFFCEGMEVRRLEAGSGSGVEVELVSMTF